MKQVFHFIACSNRPLLMEECRRYIERLYVPDGWHVEISVIADAKSMCEGYNRAIGMSPGAAPRTDGIPIRIYLHQDVFLMNRWFLHNLLTLFDSHPETGMIGLVGTPKMHPTGVWWNGEGIGTLYEVTDAPFSEERLSSDAVLHPVANVDGFLIATKIDLPWREDLFDGFDFYDVSQCFEMKKAGFRIGVPDMREPWCIHDDGLILSLYHYNRYRKVFLEHYADML